MRLSKLFTFPSVMALLPTMVFSFRFLNSFPFSAHVPEGTYETISARFSFFIYANEPITLPLGTIYSLTAPFVDANIGNVGAIPLFAIVFKFLGVVLTYFKTFDYFVLIELIACFFTSYSTIYLMRRLGVSDYLYQFGAGCLTGLSFLLLVRSDFHQPFCVLSIPLVLTYFLWMAAALTRRGLKAKNDWAIICLFPVTVLLDAYTFAALIFATGFLILIELYEAIFGGLPHSWKRLGRLLLYVLIGSGMAFGALYCIGMYPLPTFSDSFTSYDFGMGGRYHVADLLGPVIPIDGVARIGSMLSPITTSILGPGQYEGLAYVGTGTLFLFLTSLMLRRVMIARGQVTLRPLIRTRNRQKLTLLSPWGKLGLSSLGVFIFSLGYQLTILGNPLPAFAGMPAAWAADLLPALYQFRAPGRWVVVPSLFLIVSVVWYAHYVIRELGAIQSITKSVTFRALGPLLISTTLLIHLTDISALLYPVAASKAHPLSNVFSTTEIEKLKTLGETQEIAFFAPAVYATDKKWTEEAYSAALFLGIKSNLYYVARVNPKHEQTIKRHTGHVMSGNWETLNREFGSDILFIMPIKHANQFRMEKRDEYEEHIVGSLSIWGLVNN